MSAAAASGAEPANPLLAARLFATAPLAFGGLVLRGGGPVRDALVQDILAALDPSVPVARIPINVDAEHLLGGLDLAATLASGRPVRRQGVLERIAGGVLIVSMAERMAPVIAAHLAQAIDHAALAVVLLDDGLEDDEAPPAALLERAGFHCDLSRIREPGAWPCSEIASHRPRALSSAQRRALVATAAACGIHSMRPALYAERCAVRLARLDGVRKVRERHLEAAVRLVLAPRATQVPQDAAPHEPPDAPPPEGEQDSAAQEDRPAAELPLDDILLNAAAAAIPDHVLEAIERGMLRGGAGRIGKSGQKEQSARRGRPLGARPGVPGDGRKLALLDTLRAAAPWQAFRRGTDEARLRLARSDLRIRRFEQRRESLTIFAVDASGSSALARLAEAKGAVELMLAQAHVKRSAVALIAFRLAGSEVLLPPTRSLTRARRALSALPGGGGTPLAAGLRDAWLMAEQAGKRGQTPTIAVLTDGKANVTLDGTQGRAEATSQAHDMARRIAATGVATIVIDIAPRPREEARELAQVLRGRYLALPQARSAAMVAAIEAIGDAQRA